MGKYYEKRMEFDLEITDDKDGKTYSYPKPPLSSQCCGRLLTVLFFLMVVFCFWVYYAAQDGTFNTPFEGEPPFVLETDRLPMMSLDRKTLYVVTEEGLPIAHNFALRNPSVPIERIVYRKAGANNSIHIFPIQRGLLRTSDLDLGDEPIGVIAFFLTVVFLALAMYFVYWYDIFTCKNYGERSCLESLLTGGKPLDVAELDAFLSHFGGCTPESTPNHSPNAKNEKETVDEISGYFKVTFVDDKQPCTKICPPSP